MFTINKRYLWLPTLFLTLALIFAACNTGPQEPVVVVGEAGATSTPLTQESSADDLTAADVDANVLTETLAAAGTTSVTDSIETEGDEIAAQDVAVVTDTQLITGTEITTDVTVSTDTVILEQQLITTIITATDLVTDMTTLTDETTITESELTTETVSLTPARSTDAVAAVEVTELTPTPTPTVVVQITRVVTDTEIVTDTRIVTAIATPAARSAVTETTTITGVLVFIGIEGAGDNLVQASTLLDYDFENIDGEVSGEIEDVLFDATTGQVLFASLEYGGFLEIGDTELPVPLSAFTWGPEGNLVLNIEEARLQDFPQLDDTWPDGSDPVWDDEVIDFWNGIGIDPSFDMTAASNSIVRVSDIIGYAVGDIGYGAGNVEDMLIALGEGRVKYLLVSYANVNTFGNEWVAVPFSAFDSTALGNEFVFAEDFDSALLETAPRVAPGELDTTGGSNATIDDEWDSYWEDAGYSLGNAE